MSQSVKTSNLGYPRFGKQRELKRWVEAFWSGSISEQTLTERTQSLQVDHWRVQQEKGVDVIPVGDFSLYDHVLDHAIMFGWIPERFRPVTEDPLSYDTYFALARGKSGCPACEMTKWFDTNYHYIVPEIERAPQLIENKPLKAYRLAKERLGIEGKPVVIGPYTFLKLSKGYEASDFAPRLMQLTDVYCQLISELQEAGVQWVQLDEPVFVQDDVKRDLPLIRESYERLAAGTTGINLLVQTYFDGLTAYEELVHLPVQGIGLDFVRGNRNLTQLKQFGFPQDKVLAAGIVNGRNIWKTDLDETLGVIQQLKDVVRNELWIQPSASLLHLPHTVQLEDELPNELKNSLSFAEERLDELRILKVAVNEGESRVAALLSENRKQLQALVQLKGRKNREVRERLSRIRKQDFQRASEYEVRAEKQREKLNLPLLPTTTIGSFPQTNEVRKKRGQWKKGEWSDEAYRQFIKDQIKDCIELQEEIGLDVLVHGEFERNDMVEFFGEKLEGFAFTKHGWVQSYGSRGVKPPLIYGDVRRSQPMTVDEAVYAQSLTDKPVKGMLTGPVTLLNWSFAREDIPRKDIAFQIALALRDEVLDLERHGLSIIQIDEPAFREGLPLKKEDQHDYLTWAVQAFRLASSQVNDETQIHSHMCYSDFEETIEAIDELQADVISIEASRSHGELIATFEQYHYPRQIGLGVYDVHSPQIPSVDEIKRTILRSIQVIDPQQFWVNPDCGLKTRKAEEVVSSLKHLVEATRGVRKTLIEKDVPAHR